MTLFSEQNEGCRLSSEAALALRIRKGAAARLYLLGRGTAEE